MPWWRKLLAFLGLTEDARVRVRAPGIEVVITGDPDIAKSVLSVVKAEIARQSSRRRGESVAAARPPAPLPAGNAAAAAPAATSSAQNLPIAQPGRAGGNAASAAPSGGSGGGGGGGGSGGARKKKTGHSQVVRPSDLDEMDSPYAIPEHVPLEDVSETPAEGFASERTVNVDNMIESARDDESDEPEPEPTAVDVAGPQASLPPTLIPQIAPSRAPSRVAAPKVVVGRRVKDPTEPD